MTPILEGTNYEDLQPKTFSEAMQIQLEIVGETYGDTESDYESIAQYIDDSFKVILIREIKRASIGDGLTEAGEIPLDVETLLSDVSDRTLESGHADEDHMGDIVIEALQDIFINDPDSYAT